MFQHILSNLETPRVSIKKLNQLNNNEKEIFYKLFKSTSYTFSEKIDGFAFRTLVTKDKLYFESAYSGLVETKDFFNPKISNTFNNFYKKILTNIALKYNTSFKLIGELIWCDNQFDNNICTPVCTSYSKSKIGNIFSFIIFDILLINDNNYIYNDNIRKNIEYDILHINLNNIDTSLLMLNNIDINIPTFIKNTNVDILIKYLQIITDNLNSSYCNLSNNPIEGIVISFPSVNIKYGIFSSTYKSRKSIYYKHFTEFEKILNEFKKQVYGYIRNDIIIRHNILQNPSTEILFKKYYKQTLDNLLSILLNLKDDNIIPIATKNMQIFLLNKKIEKLINSNSITYINTI